MEAIGNIKEVLSLIQTQYELKNQQVLTLTHINKNLQTSLDFFKDKSIKIQQELDRINLELKDLKRQLF